MARVNRLHYPNSFYYVSAMAGDTRKIFNCLKDRSEYLAILAQKLEKTGHELHGYCLTEREIHLIIKINSTPLSKLMQAVSLGFARYKNKKYGYTGQLFHGRYNAVLFEPETYLAALIKHVHLQPAKCPEPVDANSGWLWSSHYAYTLSATPVPVCKSFFLGLFAAVPGKEIAVYNVVMNNNLFPDWPPAGFKGQVAGTKSFIDFILRATNQPRQAVNITPDETAVISIAANILECNRESLTGPSRLRKNVRMRSITAVAVQQAFDTTLSDVARILNRDVSSLSRSVTKLRETLAHDGRTNHLIEKIQTGIMQHCKPDTANNATTQTGHL